MAPSALKIERQPHLRKVLEIKDPVCSWEKGVVDLACGHEQILFEDDLVPAVGEDKDCCTCAEETYLAAVKARPAKVAEFFASQEDLLKAHPDANEWSCYGPIHRHDDGLYVQTYLGQHEWLAVKVDDVRQVHEDPGWQGDVEGYGYIPPEEIRYALDVGLLPELGPPVRRAGKPITVDQYLFAPQDKLEAYLGPEDPLVKKSS